MLGGGMCNKTFGNKPEARIKVGNPRLRWLEDRIIYES
jgi:hypothetical protein